MTAALEGGEWVVSSTPWPHFTPGKNPVPILLEAGWAPGPVWTRGNSRHHRDSTPDHPARSQSLYRLSYPAHIYVNIKQGILLLNKKMNVAKSLLDDIKTKQLQWYGHVQRMEEGRLSKEVMKWSPPGRRKRGRPKLTWAEGMRGLMGEKGLMEEDWNGRGNWRKKII